ncbi:MAG: hybrid sensor histidine kinase/response regulator [Cyanobacteria bacterium P01_F01_bin.143]
MNNHNNSHNGNPGDRDKSTIIQNFDVTSIQPLEEVNDLFGDNSSDQENSLYLNDLDFPPDSLDDAADLLPFIENDNDLEEIDLDSEINLDNIVDDDLSNAIDLPDLDELDDLVSDDLASIDIDLDTSDTSNELTELDNLLEEPLNELEELEELDELDNLLDSEQDLDDLLDAAPEKAPAPTIQEPAPKVTKKVTRPAEAPKAQAFDQTMRVSVKKLDNLNNMIGELVVKRNRLEEDQERLRRFLDNLLNHVQSLGEMGGKMHDLYERSLLEGALMASRQQNQAKSRQSSSFLGSMAEEDDDELNALELDRFTGFHLLSQDIIELIVRVREAASDIQFVVDETDQVAQSLRQVTSQLQDGMNSSRMVAFGQTTDRLPRAIRDISRRLQKQVNLVVEGKDVLIDKMIVENLYNPMTHLVNNAITHGIESPEERVKLGKSEQGTIQIRAFIQGNQTVITITDDGAGIDPERVKAKAVEKNLITWAQAQNLSKQDVYELLFHAGFSTKDQADDFAGRGVGMDVVSTDLKKIRGTISIESEIGKGTIFTVRLPLVLSICKALTCVFNGTRIAFPIDGVEDTREYHISDIHTNANGIKSISWKNSLLPFQPLGNLLSYNRRISRAGIYNVNQEEDTVSIVILRSTDNLLALEVDQVLGEQEIVIKQMEAPIPKPAGISGATVLGDGSIMSIGDVLELIEIAQGKRTINLGFSIWQEGKGNQEDEIASEPMVLVVDDSITVRELLTLSFNKLGYRVEQARDGQEAWDKLRGGLPCDMIFCDIEMPRMNGLELLSNLQKDEQLQGVPVAMLTSRGAEKHRKMATDLGAKAYLTKPYTEKDLMDVAQRLIEINQANKEAELMVVNNTEFSINHNVKPSADENPVVLIIDDSVTVRELLSMTFAKAGYQVEKAKDGQDAWDKLQNGLKCDLAFCDIEMPRMNGLELLSNLQKDTHLAPFPIAMLTSRGAQKMRNIAAKRGAKGYFVKPYVEETLLDAAEKMMNGEMLLELDAVDN